MSGVPVPHIDRTSGPKGKRSVAFALDWPGWNRGAKSVEVAPGDARVISGALPAGRGPRRDGVRRIDAAGPLEIDRGQTGMTDFYGLSFSSSSTEHGRMDGAELDRKVGAACRNMGVLRWRLGARLAGAAQGSARGRAGPEPDAVRQVTGTRARSSRSRSGCGPRRRARSPRMAFGSIGPTTSPGCVPATRQDRRRPRAWTLSFLIAATAEI